MKKAIILLIILSCTIAVARISNVKETEKFKTFSEGEDLEKFLKDEVMWIENFYDELAGRINWLLLRFKPASFSSMFFHGLSPGSVNILTQYIFAKVEVFDVVREEDEDGNSVANTTSNDITIGTNGAGTYEIAFNTSITAAGATREFIIVAGLEFASPRDITAATNASPIVVTIAGHNFKQGHMVTIAGATGNTAANGDWYVNAPNAATFELYSLSGAASTGNGAYNASSGDVTHCYPGNLMMRRSVSQNDVGFGDPSGDLTVSAGDKLSVYAANLDASTDLNIYLISLHLNRGD